MADKIDVKLVLELRQANMSQRAIASSRHITTKSVAAVWWRADALGVSYADVADKSDDEVYLLFWSKDKMFRVFPSGVKNGIMES